MRNIFNFKIRIEKVKTSSDIAKDRLHNVLAMDRVNFDPKDIAAIKKQAEKVMQGYFQIDTKHTNVKLSGVEGNAVISVDFRING